MVDPGEPALEDAIPLPPWVKQPATNRKVRPALTRGAIVDAALQVVEEVGADRLTVRRVAAELDVAPASLYGHFASKEELVQALLDRVYEEVPLPENEADDWEASTKAWLRTLREVLRRHPGVAGLTIGRIPMGERALESIERLVEAGRREGLGDRDIGFLGDLFGLYVGAFVYEEDLAERGPQVAPEAIAAMMRDWLLSLPPKRFPNLVSAAQGLSAGSVDERFEWGIDIILRGIASLREER